MSSATIQSILDNSNFPSQDFFGDEFVTLPGGLEGYFNPRFKYEHNADLCLYADKNVTLADSFRAITSEENELAIKVYDTKVPNFWSRVANGNNTFHTDKDEAHLQTHRFVIKRSPLDIGDEHFFSSISMSAVNIPQLSLFGDKAKIESDWVQFTIEHVKKKNDCDPSRYQVTHLFDACFTEPANKEVIQRFRSIVRNLLLLATGQNAGPGHIHGTNSDGKNLFHSIGYYLIDNFRMNTGNWYRHCTNKDLESLFIGFDEMYDTEDYNVLCRALQYYRASEVLDSAREVSLVASCSGLEALTSHFLRTNAGWSTSLAKKATLSERLEAYAACINLNSPILRHCSELEAIGRSWNTNGFEVITRFRNKLVHSDPDFNYSGLALWEAHSCAQWLLELFILSSLGYSGNYQDRRRRTGFTTTETTPFSLDASQ